MSGDAVVMIAAIIGVAVIIAVIASKRRSADGVDSFRRQIDALSPEARRPVVDQVQNAADRQTRDEPTDDAHDPDEHDRDHDDEGDTRGT